MISANRAYVFYDGDCAFCSGIARFVTANSAPGRFTVEPLHSEHAQEMLAASGGAPTGDTFVLLDFGKRFERSDAALNLSLGLRWPYPLGFAFILLPLRWRDAAYDFIARNRTLFNGS